MANPYNRIKQITAEIFGQRIADKADAMAQQMMADMLAKEISKDVDELVDAMVTKTPEVLPYRDRLRREIINEFVNKAKTGEEPNLEHAVRRAIMGDDDSQAVQQPVRNYVGMAAIKAVGNIDREELERQVSQCSGFVKMMCGVANNCAIQVVNMCRSHIEDIRDKESYKKQPKRPHPGYKHRAKLLFRQFFQEWHKMESALLYPSTGETRFFHVADMPEGARKKYGTMTDAQYFEFWKGTGALAYQKSLPMVTSLHNKFRLSLERHGVKHAQQTAWAMTADAVLQLACETFDRSMRSCHEVLPYLGLSFVENLWKAFSPKRPAETWRKAMLLMVPECDGYKLDSDEKRNIALGLEQLRELWLSSDLPFDATIAAVEDYDEDIFRTRGEAKKSIRELSEMRNDARREIEEIKRKG